MLASDVLVDVLLEGARCGDVHAGEIEARMVEESRFFQTRARPHRSLARHATDEVDHQLALCFRPGGFPGPVAVDQGE